MKTLFTTIIALIIATFALAQETHTVTVTVKNAKNDNGKMSFTLSTEDQFMKAQPLMSTAVTIENGVAIAVFENVPTGNYAVIALHDLNGNKSMDFDANGMPVENYGISNNPMSYGPPIWADAKFEVAKDVNLEIRL